MFITLEGIEGSGKTTQVPHMESFFTEMGVDCVVTREPGGTAIGRKIRAILLDPENTDIHYMTELLLYAADRAQHVEQVIRPALEAGKTVICDRFADATTVYQGIARGIGLKPVETLNRLVLSNIKPDLTILFDMPPEAGLKRALTQIETGERSGSESRFEKEELAFHEKIRKGYLEVAETEPERFCIINAAGNIEEVKSIIRNILKKRT